MGLCGAPTDPRTWVAAAKSYVKKMNFHIEVEKLPDFYQGKLARVLVKLILCQN